MKRIMKKQTVSLLAVLLAASAFFSSCGNTVNKNAGALEFDSIQVNETVYLFGDTAKPACNIVLNLAYVNQSTDVRLKDSLNTFFLSSCLGEKYMTMTADEAAKRYKEQYISDYRKDLEPMYLKEEQDLKEGEEIGTWYSYYKDIESRVQLYHQHLLVYRIDYHEYTGGAHGIYMSSFLNMDLRTLSPVRLEDLFVEDYEEELTELLWKQLMEDNHAQTRQEVEDMGYCSTGDLAPIENFYLGREGITFYYNVYEIAPYAMGPVKITLSYETLQHLLSDDLMVLNEVRNS